MPRGTTRGEPPHDPSVTRPAAKMNAVQLHGFADESRRGPLYLITVVTVPTDGLDAARRAVGAVVQRGSKRTHLSAEGAARRRQILGEYAQLGLGVEAHVAVAAYDRGDDQVPRDRCLATLLETCRDLGITRLTLDTRHPDRDRLDRRTIAVVLRDKLAPFDLDYVHRGSRDEPLLSLPDAIGWAWGAGGSWRRLVEPMIGSVSHCDGP